MMKIFNIVCLCVGALTLTGVAGEVPRVFVDLPQGPPVLAVEAVVDVPPLAERISDLVEGMGHETFGERSKNRRMLATLICEKGGAAYDLLNTEPYRKHEDPEIAVSVREVLKSIEPQIIPPLDWTEVETLIAKGLTPKTLQKLNEGGLPVAEMILRAHLRMEVGVDVLYSLRPEHILPVAARLLALQKEDYYRVLLAKAMAGSLARAVKPIDPEPSLNLEGIEYLRTHPDLVQAVVALTSSACDELRWTGLQLCAYGLIPLSQEAFQALLDDPNRDIAEEAVRLQGVFVLAEDGAVDPVYAAWVEGCQAALSQSDDLLAQLGAYHALSDLQDAHGDLLYASYSKSEGRPKDALRFILSNSLTGRLLLIKHGRTSEIRSGTPASLNRLMALRTYDIKLQGLAELSQTEGDAVAPLLRRNLYVLGRSEQSWFGRVVHSRDAWSAAVQQGMSDLAPLLKLHMSKQKNSDEYVPLLKALAETEGERFMLKPARAWYARCAAQLDAGALDIRTGALRSLLASGKAGAEALLARQQEDDGAEEAFSVYLKSLILFHPYSKFLVDDSEAGQVLAAALASSGLEFSKHVRSGQREGSSRQIYEGGQLRIPVALWGYVNNNDCNAINPLGNYLAENLKTIHTPLLLSWLDHSSRMSIFLVEVEAQEAREAVLRRLMQRRRDWSYCYDHDLFNYVVVYELLEALPYLEHYTKTNTNWPSKGVRTMAGIEKERYCWTDPMKSGRVNPLVVPSCLELIKYHGDKQLVREQGNEILKELKVHDPSHPWRGPKEGEEK